MTRTIYAARRLAEMIQKMARIMTQAGFSKIYLATVLALIPAAPAFAEADSSDGPANPREIVVTGRGLPETPATPAYDVQVMERDKILSSGSGRIEDVLTSVAGFQQFRRSDSRSSNPSAQGATLRALGGNATSRALLLLDGVPMADPFFGYIPFSAITPERLSRVRVTRGGGAGAFGSGAIAGTIEMESADASTLGLVNGGVLVNNRGETETSAQLAPKIGSGFAVIEGRWDRGEGFYTTPADQRVPATARAKYESWSASARLVQPLSDDIELQARGLFFDDNRTLRFKGADSSSSGQDVSLRLVGRGDWQFDVLGYAQWRNFSNIVISSTSFRPTLNQYDTPANGQGGKIEIRPPVGDDHVLRIGADFRRSHGRMEENALNGATGAITTHNSAGGTNTDLGLFLEDDWTLGNVILTAGARADRWTIRDGYYQQHDGSGVLLTDNRFGDRSGWDASFRGGVLVKVSEAVRLRGAAYTGLRLPTLNELYRPFVVFPVRTEANANLGMEKLRGFEAGVELRPAEGVSVALTAFDNRVRHAIGNVTVAPNVRRRQNIDEIRAQGLEFSASVERGSISVSGTVAYTDAKVRENGVDSSLDGLRPAQTPKWAASGTLGWAPRKDWLLSVTLRYVGNQYEDDLETDILPGATTVDAFARVPLWGRLNLVLRGENLFDKTVITRNQGGSIDLDVPRTIWAGLRYGF
jgi:outer membrane receptor protein involved in Fe transport